MNWDEYKPPAPTTRAYIKPLEEFGYSSNQDWADDPNYAGRRDVYAAQNSKYGFNETECWNMDHTMVEILYERMLMFRDTMNERFVTDGFSCVVPVSDLVTDVNYVPAEDDEGTLYDKTAYTEPVFREVELSFIEFQDRIIFLCRKYLLEDVNDQANLDVSRELWGIWGRVAHYFWH